MEPEIIKNQCKKVTVFRDASGMYFGYLLARKVV
jgi:hypothetical protein